MAHARHLLRWSLLVSHLALTMVELKQHLKDPSLLCDMKTEFCNRCCKNFSFHVLLKNFFQQSNPGMETPYVRLWSSWGPGFLQHMWLFSSQRKFATLTCWVLGAWHTTISQGDLPFKERNASPRDGKSYCPSSLQLITRPIFILAKLFQLHSLILSSQ